jgi:hypothetical protein
LFDKKNTNFFSPFFFSAKNSRFITSAGGGVGAREQKNKVEKRISFFIGHEVLFYETTFSASALEH